MTRYEFAFTDVKPSSTEAYAEATVQELKVLLALYEFDGVCTEDELLSASGVSKSRLASGIALWKGEGVIVERSADMRTQTPYGNIVTEEFEESLVPDKLYEETALEAALSIRNQGLASLIDECAAMMGKAMLSPSECKRIANLSSQYALSEEYIAILASHLAEKGCLTVTRLVSRAVKLTEKDINTPEQLEDYIRENERELTGIAEVRREMNFYDRSFSKREEEYIIKWMNELGYDAKIIGEAYGLCTVATGKRSFRYVDVLLEDWHSAGCKKLEDCIARYEAVNIERENAYRERKAQPQTRPAAGKKTEKKKPRYGDFDPEEALRRALERSFPFDDETPEENSND